MGLLYDSKLRFDIHIINQVNAARKLIGFIFRQWGLFNSPAIYIFLNKVLIRPKLEFASVIWNNVGITLSNKIEAVQKLLVRMVCHRAKLDYFDNSYSYWLNLFSLEMLKDRRDRNDAKFMCKVLNYKYKAGYMLNKICVNVPLYNTRNCVYLSAVNNKKIITKRLVQNYNRYHVT